MTKSKDPSGREVFHCPVDATMSKLGGKYKAIIVYRLVEDGTLRFSQPQSLIPQATPKMLSQQLHELEADGLVHREVYPVVPPKTEYSLTALGSTMAPIVREMCAWSNAHMADQILPQAEMASVARP